MRAFYDLVSLVGGIRIECSQRDCAYRHDEMFEREDHASIAIALGRCDELIAEHFAEAHSMT